nr:hypothetical protein [Tanacetum cinerariifolium]
VVVVVAFAVGVARDAERVVGVLVHNLHHLLEARVRRRFQGSLIEVEVDVLRGFVQNFLLLSLNLGAAFVAGRAGA